MKRSSPYLDRQTSDDDDERGQTTYSKIFRHLATQPKCNDNETNETRPIQTSMDQRVENETSSWSPQYSSILGSLSDPPTYIIHLLDPRLTFSQSFQICSLFGRVRIHGYNLRPLTFSSIYNYRTNSPLGIEYVPSATKITTTLQDVKSVISDSQLADYAFSTVQQKGGDILLVRKEPKSDSLFLNILRDHRLFGKWFFEPYPPLERGRWRELEKDLYIRLIETTDQTAIVVHEQFIQTADRLINRWLNETTEYSPLVVLICGEKDMGKSTLIRYITNRALTHIDSKYDLTYFDCDIGQCEFSIGGCLSYINLDVPLLGPPCSHIKSNPKPDRLLCYGLLSPQTSPVRYLQYVDKLRQLWNRDHENVHSKRSMILINTMGWGIGLGLEILKETICMCNPNIIIQLGDTLLTTPDRNRMPDVTLEWLLQQPVFSPYRHQMQMSSRRERDYDGQLNYEYIKIQSPTVNIPHSGTPKLRARDHRLLATWSYFFSSNLTHLCLPWSQLIHVSLQDNQSKLGNVSPDRLEHSLVAFCISDNINEIRNAAVSANGILQLFNYQDQLLECSGFGWIERCNKDTQSYELYTPIDIVPNTHILVSGAFDTPEEFQYIFRQTFVK